MLGEERNAEWFEEFHFADQAVATSVLSLAAGTSSNRKLPQSNRVALFEDLRIGDGGVGHVGVKTAGAIIIGTGAGSAADGFVVAETVVAEDEIVHRSL